MTIEEWLQRLRAEATYCPKGLNTEVGFATSPGSDLEVLSGYYSPEDGKFWFGLGEKESTMENKNKNDRSSDTLSST